MRGRYLFAACLLTGVALLSACKREPSFDERYAGAQKTIREKSDELDKDMKRRSAEDRTRGPVIAPVQVPQPTPGSL